MLYVLKVYLNLMLSYNYSIESKKCMYFKCWLIVRVGFIMLLKGNLIFVVFILIDFVGGGGGELVFW